jgi:hypothetical protein
LFLSAAVGRERALKERDRRVKSKWQQE